MKADEFFRKFSTALLVWQHVEEALYQFMASMFDKSDFKRVGAIYYSQESFSGKLRVADAAAQVTLDPEQLRDWTKLAERMKKAAADRNVLAHFNAVADVDDSAETIDLFADVGLMLKPPMFVPDEVRRIRTKKYDAAGCAVLVQEFLLLTRDVQEFTLRGRPMRH